MTSEPPRWLVVTAFAFAAAVVSLGVCGLFLAVTATYSAPLAFALATPVFVGLLVLVVPHLPRPEALPRSAVIVAAIGVAAIVAITVWNGANASQHVVINRDGGAYANAGRWIAREGNLEVHPKIGAFRHDPNPRFADIGTDLILGSSIRMQFHGAHLLPALLAEGHAVGGDSGMFLLPPLLGGIALLEFFVVAWRLLRQPIFALVAVGALAFIVPEVAFVRDTYSETVAQVLLFGALVLLIDRRLLPHWRVALGAGLLLGAIQAARIDAPLVFVGIPVLMTVAWLHAKNADERRAIGASNRALALGLVPGFVLGLFDVIDRSEVYWNDQWNQEHALFILIGVISAGCLITALLWPRLSPRLSRVPWDTVGWISGAVVVLAALGAWFIRPVVSPGHLPLLAALQRHGDLVVRYETAHFENSMWWMSWYLGPVTLLAAIIGAGCLTRSLVRGRRLYVLAPLLLFLPESLLYLWNAHAYTDHVWVTRRYLTSTFPMLILLAVGLAAALWTARPQGAWAKASRAAAIVIAIGAVAFPIWTVMPVRSMHEQGGYLTTVKQACRVLGPKAAVVVLQGPTMVSDTREDWIPQTLRGWCGVPVASLILDIDNHAELMRLASRWNDRHRKLFIVATGGTPIHQVAPEAQLTALRTAVNRRLLTQTFSHRPDRYETQSFSLVIGALPAKDVQ